MPCECNIVSNFPGLKGQGITSANLRSNKSITITSEGILLIGPTIGELSITAYASYNSSNSFECPGRAGVTYEWMQRYDCLADKVYFIPRGGEKSFIEGDVSDISMIEDIKQGEGFSASAASGPHTVYLKSDHIDGHNFSYTGSPIAVTGRDTTATIITSLLSVNVEVYLTNFSWQQTPPGIPTVSYSFVFSTS
jgi:hypothetical protein